MSLKIPTAIGWSLIFIILRVHGALGIETLSEWEYRHEFSSANAFEWKQTLLQVAVRDKLLHISTIDPNVESPVNCTIPNKTGRKWPLDTDYGLVSLENGRVVVVQREVLEVVDVTSCIVDAELNQSCRLILPHSTTFDCFLDASYTRYDDMGRVVGSFNISGILGDGIRSVNLQKCGDSYCTWEPQGKRADLTDPRNPMSVARVRILNENYQSLSDHSLPTRIYSAHSFAHGNLTVCDQWFNYTGLRNTGHNVTQEFLGYTECRLYDQRLAHRTTARMNLPLESVNENVFLFSANYLVVHNLPGGGAIVLFQVSSDEVFYRVIDSNGIANTDNEVFYKYQKSPYNLEEELNFSRMYLFEKSADERIYCGVFGVWRKFSAKCAKF